MRTAIPLFLLIAVMQLPGFENEEPFRYRASPQGWSAFTAKRLDELLNRFQDNLSAGVFDPQATELLAASGRYTKQILQVPDLRQTRAVTQRTGKGDLLLTEWQVTQPFGTGILCLWDDPYRSEYLLRLPGYRIRSPEDLTKLLINLVAWNQPPLNLAPAGREVQIAMSGPAIKGFHTAVLFSSAEGPYDFDLQGVQRDSGWLISLGLGKGLVRGYPLPPFIPERFPPLTELVKEWSAGRIWSEISTGSPQDKLWAERRDKVLVGELLHRGLTVTQLVELLTNTDQRNLRNRAIVMFEVLDAAEKWDLLKAAVPGALESYGQRGREAEGAVLALFQSASRACSTEVEQQALHALRQRDFLDGPLAYLANCSTSEATLQALQDLTPTDTNIPGERALRHARESIQKRLNHPWHQ